MKVAIDISPTKTGHKVRGIGSYTSNLIKEFRRGEWGKTEFGFFDNPATPPPADVIHYPYFNLFFHTLPVKSKTSRVVTIHDVIPLIFPEHFQVGVKGKVNFFLQKLALKNIDAIICDSQTSKEDIASRLSVPREKISVIYLAADHQFKKIDNQSRLTKVSKKYKLPKEFVLYVGDVNWNKNLQNLLESIKITGVNLVMVGQALTNKSLPQTQALDKLIKKMNLSEKIVKTGYIPNEDLVSIYNIASLIILPSYYEGFGLPILESMVCGTPVICSNVASLTEIGKDTAVFCDPTDPNDISKKIDMILKFTTIQKEKASQKLIKRASKFSWQKVATETIKVYKSVSLLNG